MKFKIKLVSKLFFLSLIVFSCNDKKESEIYELLSVCNDEFYLDYGIIASDELMDFENELIQEGHLVNNEPKSYIVLFRKLKKELYFSPPLKKENFKNALLYENPKNLFECMESTFRVDSLSLSNLAFTSFTDGLANLMSTEEEINVRLIFDYYANNLDENLLQYSYVKYSTLHFLYKWYFMSKYNREIPLDDLFSEE